MLALSFAPAFASADEPTLAAQVQRRVEEGLLKPLVDLDSRGSRFSRARPMPRERRVRILQATATLDGAARPFVAFAIDVRFGGGEWQENDIVGCAYPRTGDLFVKRGDAYRRASFLLGKSSDPVPNVCQAAARS